MITRLTRLVGAAALALAGTAQAFPSQDGQGPGQGPGGGGGPGHRPPSFEELDVDGDGSVTFEEFLAPMQTHLSERWTQLDADGDERLSEAELRAGGPPQGQNGGQHGPGDGSGLRGGQPRQH